MADTKAERYVMTLTAQPVFLRAERYIVKLSYANHGVLFF